VALLLVASSIGVQRKTVDEKFLHSLKSDFNDLFLAVPKALKTFDEIKRFAPKFKDATNALYLGRGTHFPVALEGALKLKEISYIHAEGLPAAEMKHGPIALIDENMPVVVLAPHDHLYQKILSNMQEVKARGGRIIVFASHRDAVLEKLADELVIIPQVSDLLQPIISVIPLQLLAYELALLRGCDVDKPRNLSKCVSVE
jgi:glucosamine--fructose-6-phosphate aminotransferase (isomerizing)